MDTVRSTDGTLIAFERSGSGPPLVVVHGTSANHLAWTPVLPMLEKDFTVCALDRRGRGASGDAAAYEIGREYEDVAAVVDAIGQPVDLCGHSFGALCSLEAALLTSHIRRLILYEPPIATGTLNPNPPGLLEKMHVLLTANERDTLLSVFLSEVAGLSAHDLELRHAQPDWVDRVANVHTVVREADAVDAYRFEPGRFANLTIPTLLLVGGSSPRFFRAAIELLNQNVPNSRVGELAGQGHVAVGSAPELFARTVTEFLRGPD